MFQLSRPIAETVLMMLKIIASQPPHTGTVITALPTFEHVPSEVDSNIEELPVTNFTSNADVERLVVVREPAFEDINYKGVHVIMLANGIASAEKDYVGTEIADIGTDIFKFLAVRT